MLKILLINPPYSFNSATAKTANLAMDKKPPLGLLYIATYIKKNSEFDIKILDCELEKMTEKQIKESIFDFNPHIIGISAVSFKIFPVVRILKIAKEISPKIHICVGGPHVKIYPKETLDYEEVDSIVIGDGEKPFLEICNNFSASMPVEEITGCYTRKNIPENGIFKKFELIDLDALPILDLSLVDYKKYRSFLTNDIIMTVVTSRGCPYSCIFCQLDQKVRMISIDRVISEIESYLKLGIKEIEFYDETFNVSVERVIEFADKVRERGLKFNWSFRGRVNAVSEEMLQKIKQAGCQRIQYGVEAGSDKTLRNLKKGITIEMVKKCFALTKKQHIETVAYFMFGNPGEQREDIMQTINLAKEIKADYVNFAIFLLVPGVEAYKMAISEGVLKKDDWLEYVRNPQKELPALYWEKELSKKELVKLRSLAICKFYFRWTYIMEKLKHLSVKNFASYLKAFYYMAADAFLK